MSAPFDPKKANAAAKAKKKELMIPKKPKTEVSNFLQRKADMTHENKELDKTRSLVIAEELKRYNFLADFDNINWDRLRQFYNNPDEFNPEDDDYVLYFDHLDMTRWRLFVKLVLFLHDNVDDQKSTSTYVPKSKIKSKITSAAVRSMDPLAIPYALKRFNLEIDEKTSIQQLLSFIKKYKHLRRRFIKNNNDDDDDDDEDVLFDDFDEEFDIFFNKEDDIEYNTSLGIGQKERPPRMQMHQPLDEDVKKHDQIKEVRKKWESKTSLNQHTQNVRRYNRYDKLRNNDRIGEGPIKHSSSLIAYFGEKDARNILDTIYNRTMDTDGTLNDYLFKIAHIAVFVDPVYLKEVAKTFNEKLEKQYYNLDSLLDLTIDEILQEIYQHPDNRDSIASITEQVYTQIEKYIQNIMKHLTNQPYKQDDVEQHKESLETSLKAIQKSPSLTKRDCSNKDDISSTEDFDIIYYTDIEDKKVYCFKLFDLYEQFEKEDFDNHKSGKKFNQTFIDNILFHHKKPKSPVKIKEKSSIDDLQSPVQAANVPSAASLFDFFKEIENDLDPSLKDEYEKEFGGSLFEEK